MGIRPMSCKALIFHSFRGSDWDLGRNRIRKSSLVQLIPRLYDVESGRVTVAGHDVKEYDLDSLRQASGHGSSDQCPFLWYD